MVNKMKEYAKRFLECVILSLLIFSIITVFRNVYVHNEYRNALKHFQNCENDMNSEGCSWLIEAVNECKSNGNNSEVCNFFSDDVANNYLEILIMNTAAVTAQSEDNLIIMIS